MPRGRTHMLIELGLLPSTLLIFHLVDRSWGDLVLFTSAYLAGSFFLSPDLDLYYNACKRRWGRLGVLWAPYSLFSRHRGLSHHPVWGPLIRLVYVGVPTLILVTIFVHRLGIPWDHVLNLKVLFLVVMGIATSNLTHVLVDHLWSSIKYNLSR